MHLPITNRMLPALQTFAPRPPALSTLASAIPSAPGVPMSIELNEPSDTAPLPRPPELHLPLFVYGTLRRGELGNDQIADAARATEPASVSAALRVLDGLPVLDPGLGGEVAGDLIWFDDASDGYDRVCRFEPSSVYRWTTLRAAGEGREIEANALVAALLPDGKGDVLGPSTGADLVEGWSVSADPLFAYGLPAVAAMASEAALKPFRPGIMAGASEWKRFYQVQAAYLLACSVLERIAYFSLGARLKPTARVRELGRRPDFKVAAREAGVTEPSRAVGLSSDPADRRSARPSGAGFAERAYRIRSNVMHRGKSAYHEAELVRGALLDLHDTLRIYLTGRAPALRETWSQLDGAGAQRDWRIKPID